VQRVIEPRMSAAEATDRIARFEGALAAVTGTRP
jgi:hypothetical protein